jgi:hypothetical protein
MLQRYFLKKILEENVSKIFHIRSKETTIYCHNAASCNQRSTRCFEAGADIVETNTSQEPPSEWPITT